MATVDQIKAIHSEKKQVVVTASAGSGKTYTMVNRVIRLIAEEGAPISSILMLTFTEAAAQEMKTRLFDALLREIKASPDKRERLLRAIDELPLLNCGTIDSFCYKLVKTNFELIGISPMHAVADETLMKAYRNRALDEVLKELHERDEAAYLALYNRFGSGEEDDLRECIEDVYDFARKTEDEKGYLAFAEDIAKGSLEDAPAVKAYMEYLRRESDRLREEIVRLYEMIDPTAKDMQTRVAYFVNTLDDYRRCRTFGEFLNCVVKAERLPSVTAKSKEKNLRSAVPLSAADDLFLPFRKKVTFGDDKKYIFESYEKTLADVESANKDLLRLIETVRAFWEKFAARKDREQLLDYDDLEHYAFRLLRDHGVGKEVRFRYLLVDECQDLNPLQDSLIRMLAEKGDLFMVGDVKQSIYRFRLSDPDLFMDRIDRGKENEESTDVITFRENFRSSDEVIRFVNLVFSGLMTRSFGSVDYAGEELVGQSKGTGIVRCFIGRRGQKANAPVAGVYSVKNAVGALQRKNSFGEEAEWIRDRILERVGQPYRDTKTDETRLISYRDIAILSATRMRPGSRQEKIVRCLREAGIPLNVGDFEKKKKSYEIDVIVDLLRLIEDPHDDYALLAVLRSDLFGADLDDLAKIALEEGKTFAEKAERVAKEGRDPRLAGFYDYLAELRFLASAMTLYDLVSRVIEEKFRLPVLRRQDGRQIYGELLTFASSLKGIPQASSVSEFIAFYDEYYTPEASGGLEDGNAVSLMTVHGSKGMEFPIVFYICPDTEKKDQDPLRIDKSYGIAKKTASEEEKTLAPNLPFLLLTRKKKKELSEDKLRLLYVALTRARNELYISATLAESVYENAKLGEDSTLPAVWLAAALKGKFPIERENVPTERPAVGEAARAAALDDDALLRLKEAFSYVYPHKKATETGIKFTVTAINDMDEEGYYPPTLLFSEEKKAKGTAFHAVLENAPFTLTEEETAPYLDKLVREGVISLEERRDISAKAVFGAIRKVRELVGDRKVYREKSFILRLPARDAKVADIDDAVEVQGKIDLLAVGEKDAIIVDYKLSGLSAEALKEKYCEQLALYAVAVRQALGIQEIARYIFVPGRNELIAL